MQILNFSNCKRKNKALRRYKELENLKNITAKVLKRIKNVIKVI